MSFLKRRFGFGSKPHSSSAIGSDTPNNPANAANGTSSPPIKAPKLDVDIPAPITLSVPSSTPPSASKSETDVTLSEKKEGDSSQQDEDDLDVWVDLGNPSLELGDRIDRARIGPKQCTRLVRICSNAIKERGLTVLGIFRPYRSGENPEAIRRILSTFLDLEEVSPPPTSLNTTQQPSSLGIPSDWIINQKPTFEEEIQRANIHDVVAVLKWGLRHLVYPGHGFSGDPDPFAFYAHFRANEAARLQTPEAYRYCFIPIVPPTHSKLVSLIVDLISHVASHSEINAMSGSRLCYLLGFWVFGCSNHRDKAFIEGKRERPYDMGLQDLYREWKIAGTCLEHLFLAWLRIQKDLPPRLSELLKKYPPPPAEVDRASVTCLRATVLTQGDWNKEILHIAGHPPDPLVARWSTPDDAQTTESDVNASLNKSKSSRSSTAHAYFSSMSPASLMSPSSFKEKSTNALSKDKKESSTEKAKKLTDLQRPTTPPDFQDRCRKSAFDILQDALEAEKVLPSKSMRIPISAQSQGEGASGIITTSSSATQLYEAALDVIKEEDEDQPSNSHKLGTSEKSEKAALATIGDETNDDVSTVSAGTVKGKDLLDSSAKVVEPIEVWKSLVEYARGESVQTSNEKAVVWGRSLDDPSSIISSEHQSIFKKLERVRTMSMPSSPTVATSSYPSKPLESPFRNRSFSLDAPRPPASAFSTINSIRSVPNAYIDSHRTPDWASFASLGFEPVNDEVEKGSSLLGNKLDLSMKKRGKKSMSQEPPRAFSPLRRFQSTTGSQRKNTATKKSMTEQPITSENAPKLVRKPIQLLKENSDKKPFTVVTSLSYVRIEEIFADVWLDALGDPDIIAKWPYFVFFSLSDPFMKDNQIAVAVDDTDGSSEAADNTLGKWSKLEWVLVEQHLHPFLQKRSQPKADDVSVTETNEKTSISGNSPRPTTPGSSSSQPKKSRPFAFSKLRKAEPSNRRLSSIFGLSRVNSGKQGPGPSPSKVVLSWDDPRLPDLMAQEHRSKHPEVAEKDIPDFAALIGQDKKEPLNGTENDQAISKTGTSSQPDVSIPASPISPVSTSQHHNIFSTDNHASSKPSLTRVPPPQIDEVDEDASITSKEKTGVPESIKKNIIDPNVEVSDEGSIDGKPLPPQIDEVDEKSLATSEGKESVDKVEKNAHVEETPDVEKKASAEEKDISVEEKETAGTVPEVIEETKVEENVPASEESVPIKKGSNFKKTVASATGVVAAAVAVFEKKQDDPKGTAPEMPANNWKRDSLIQADAHLLDNVNGSTKPETKGAPNEKEDTNNSSTGLKNVDNDEVGNVNSSVSEKKVGEGAMNGTAGDSSNSETASKDSQAFSSSKIETGVNEESLQKKTGDQQVETGIDEQKAEASAREIRDDHTVEEAAEVSGEGLAKNGAEKDAGITDNIESKKEDLESTEVHPPIAEKSISTPSVEQYEGASGVDETSAKPINKDFAKKTEIETDVDKPESDPVANPHITSTDNATFDKSTDSDLSMVEKKESCHIPSQELNEEVQPDSAPELKNGDGIQEDITSSDEIAEEKSAKDDNALTASSSRNEEPEAVMSESPDNGDGASRQLDADLAGSNLQSNQTDTSEGTTPERYDTPKTSKSIDNHTSAESQPVSSENAVELKSEKSMEKNIGTTVENAENLESEKFDEKNNGTVDASGGKEKVMSPVTPDTPIPPVPSRTSERSRTLSTTSPGKSAGKLLKKISQQFRRKKTSKTLVVGTEEPVSPLSPNALANLQSRVSDVGSYEVSPVGDGFSSEGRMSKSSAGATSETSIGSTPTIGAKLSDGIDKKINLDGEETADESINNIEPKKTLNPEEALETKEVEEPKIMEAEAAVTKDIREISETEDTENLAGTKETGEDLESKEVNPGKILSSTNNHETGLPPDSALLSSLKADDVIEGEEVDNVEGRNSNEQSEASFETAQP